MFCLHRKTVGQTDENSLYSENTLFCFKVNNQNKNYVFDVTA